MLFQSVQFALKALLLPIELLNLFFKSFVGLCVMLDCSSQQLLGTLQIEPRLVLLLFVFSKAQDLCIEPLVALLEPYQCLIGMVTSLNRRWLRC